MDARRSERGAVLCIDADASAKPLIKSVVENEGFAIHFAENAEEGKTLLGCGKFSLCLLGDRLAERDDGLDLVACCARKPGIPPIVVMVGVDRPMAGLTALQLGAADYVIKGTGPGWEEFLPSAIRKTLKIGMIEGREEDEAERMFSRLVDRGDLQQTLQDFCNIVGISSALIDLKGRVLAASRWQPLCTDFHRINKETCARCIESDTDLSLKLQEGQQYAIYRCKNGLTDCASPIVVEGRHVANIFVGQFLLAPPDREAFLEQARQFGFDEKAYLDALDQVPVIQEEKLPHILGFLTGITRLVTALILEKRRAEAAVDERTDSLRKILPAIEQSPVSIMITNRDGEIEYVNPYLCALTGYRAEELVGKNARILKGGQTGDDDYKNLWATISAGGIWQGELLNRKKNGDLFWEAVSIGPVRDSLGNINHFVGIKEDITERKRVEKELADSRRLFESVIEQSPIPMVIATPAGVLTFNKACAEFLGIADEPDMKSGINYSTMNQTWKDFDAQGNPIAHSELPLALALQGKTVRDKEMRAVRKDGTERWEIVNSAPIYDDDGKLIAAFVAFPDITGRKIAESELRRKNEELERSNEELESFAYVSSHDLREPLRNVTSYSTLLSRRLAGRLSADEQEFLGFIHDGALRMDSLISDLLEYSRLGRSNLTLTEVDAKDAVSSAAEALRVQLDECKGELRIASDLPIVLASGDELQRIFQNLIGNALKYRSNQRAPVITIGCVKDGTMWRFLVQDNGIGIQPGLQFEERIFGLFERLHSRKEYGGGTGIGLAICKKIVERLGGKIWATSLGLDQGSVFTFTLPAQRTG